MRIIDHFAASVRGAARYNPNVQAAPHCILWTDSDRQWEVIITRLQQEIPELFVLGEYDPALRRGPAIWLRCVLARVLPDVIFPTGVPPIFYLPGVSRQDLRAVDSCPDHLKPLAEVQYRGVIWSQTNAKDWTILAFLQTEQGGLGLDVAQDKETRAAMQLTLPDLMNIDAERFRTKRLDRSDFYQLISSDPTGDLLKWLDDSEAFRKKRSPAEWRAFVELCRYQFSFNPESEGPIAAAEKLAAHTGVWSAIWQRYREAYAHYTHIPERLQQGNPPSNMLEWRDPTSDFYDGWPQWNEYHENELRSGLLEVNDQTPVGARKAILKLEQLHRHRRQMVWSDLDRAPLAQALEYLAILATTTADTPLEYGSLDEVAASYQLSGWRADDAVMRALACIKESSDQKAVEAAIRAIYLPWAEKSARYLQQCVAQFGYPLGKGAEQPTLKYRDNTCVFFVDGLRFDVAQRLVERLTQLNFDVQTTAKWAALPSVTATAKPAVSPVSDQITGSDVNADFEPEAIDTHKSINHYNFSKMLTNSGWQILKNEETGNPTGKAWFEFGSIDQAGHNGDLPRKLEALLIEISNHVQRLHKAGWKQIQIVTDHGWLYAPGGLPKVDLPSVLTENQWGRCAAIKFGVTYDGPMFPWFWNPNQYFALADGISCYRNNVVYAHGGLTVQECVTVSLAVTQGSTPQTVSVSISDVDWREMRCDVIVEGKIENLTVDIRTQANNEHSSIASKVKPLKTNGTASLVVEDEGLVGDSAFVVLLNDVGNILAQKVTIVGGAVDA